MNSIKLNRIQKKLRQDIKGNINIPGPEKIFAVAGNTKGDINLIWEPVKNAYSYAIQRSYYRKENLKWHHVDIVDQSYYFDTGLKSGRSYCFRVAAITNKGQGKWSKLIKKKVI